MRTGADPSAHLHSLLSTHLQARAPGQIMDLKLPVYYVFQSDPEGQS